MTWKQFNKLHPNLTIKKLEIYMEYKVFSHEVFMLAVGSNRTHMLNLSDNYTSNDFHANIIKNKLAQYIYLNLSDPDFYEVRQRIHDFICYYES